ncbi:urease accessory protein UreD [Fuscibacter oryzae]|uniref:Urease accessory protein UreD n=1 Tax=Fuscibacter oryzae TaxID=2803939 RepID=A0A8J7MVB3_9RHOB|nr:urease accessory protein UreD [Fuscibacter oryzae]MBL4929168.1 urease accessory protein UreD [Fuscibacter oryzae]
MFDNAPTAVMQRSRGLARAGFALRDGAVRLTELQQAGSGKAMLPRLAGDVPEVVFLNTSGGLTSGDRLGFDLTVGPRARVCATTQTAERAYSADSDAAKVDMTARVGAGGRLDWLPQETLLYEGSNLTRRTTIDLAGDATCLLCESLVLGRLAMGEEPQFARLDDRRLIRRDHRPVWADALRLNPAALGRQASPALLGGARAMAVIAFVTQGAEDALPPVRQLLTEPEVTAAASGWDGRLLVRLLARDGWPLRRQLARVLHLLSGRPLPRVWQMHGVLA